MLEFKVQMPQQFLNPKSEIKNLKSVKLLGRDFSRIFGILDITFYCK
jgi:hypothetical protein